jgi:hypothetical protein
MKFFLIQSWFSLILIPNGHLHAQYHPVKQDTMSVEKYEKLIENLDKIDIKIKSGGGGNYMSNAYVNKGSALSRLSAPKDSVFMQVEYAFLYDSLTTCGLIAHFQNYGSYGFRDYCLKVDSAKWLNWCIICAQKLQLRDSLKKEKLKTTLNPILIRQLAQISEDDQRFRADSFFDKSHSRYWEFYQLRKMQDSINLRKVETMIQEYGYPGEKLVGEQSMTAFNVLQHITDLKTREAFLPLIQKAVREKDLSKNTLMLFLDRIYLDKYSTQIWGSQQIWDDAKQKYVSAPIDVSETALKLKKEVDDM